MDLDPPPHGDTEDKAGGVSAEGTHRYGKRTADREVAGFDPRRLLLLA